MPPFSRTRLSSLESSLARPRARFDPPAISLTVQGSARVRVCGYAYGFVRCAGERRWVWGAFDQTFLVARSRKEVLVSAIGLTGFARRSVRFASALDLTLARPRTVIGRVHWRAPRIPRLRPLSADTLQRGLSEHERG